MAVYRCPVCSKPFKRNEHLSRHKRSHYSDRPFTCPLCLRSFTRQDTLLRHMSSHAKPPAARNSVSFSTAPSSTKRPYEEPGASTHEPLSLPRTTTSRPQYTDDRDPDSSTCTSILLPEQQMKFPPSAPSQSQSQSQSQAIDVPPELSEIYTAMFGTPPGMVPSGPGPGRVIELNDDDDNDHDIDLDLDLDSSDISRFWGGDGSSPPLTMQTSNLTRSSASPVLDRYPPHASGSGSKARRDQQPQQQQQHPFELPAELFSSAVDLHARTWLRDFCAGGG
ncbi:hypothetical protein AYL99_07115 [Fonsecaea erecta]|uniref:C2H2-type domain-containing protein n=1 Tax=Fonsecaea erecta TaxID=1367422 RepID=A0A178ZG46_9EURO|nr:hypothetical protein AYL99_07115 [Fonsecaea erecta]OAP58025.1 hypothetical protein AYL99_07115 [Fonsecaea erecta]